MYTLPTLLLLAAVTTSRSTFAQKPDAPARPLQLSADVRAEVVDTVAAELSRFYAVADTGQLIAEYLRKRLAAHAYDALTDPRIFAEAVTVDLRAVNHDKHLALTLGAPGGVTPLGTPKLPPVTPGAAPGGSPSPAMVDAERRINFRLGRVDVLAGNVGYFQINGFSSVGAAMGRTQDAMVNALKYLENTDAIIFDLRENGGGLGSLSNLLISHFVGEDTLPVLDIDVRAAGQKITRYTAAEVPGPRRPTVPVYILVGRGTVSAGEDFAFVMKNLGRATLVGEPTAGAGRNNRVFDAGHGFAVSISISRVSDPKTGAEWEGTGVIPNVRTPVRSALTAAHQLALAALAAKAADPALRRTDELIANYVAAQAKPHHVAAELLKEYEGLYGARTVVTVENGQLIVRQDSTSFGIELVAFNDTTFGWQSARYRFERDPRATYRIVVCPDCPNPLVLGRTGPPPKIPSEYVVESGKPK